MLISLLTLVFHQAQGQKEIFTKELVILGNYLAFGSWAWRLTRVKSEIVTNFLFLALVSRRRYTF